MIDFLFVNHHPQELAYMEAQAHIFKVYNPEGNYRLLVADGTEDTGHKKNLENLDFTVIPHKQIARDRESGWDHSSQHGRAMDILLQHVEAPILCAQHPDHFWVMQDFCAIAEKLMETYIAISLAHNFLIGKTAETMQQVVRKRNIAEQRGELCRATGLISFEGGVFLRTQMIRDNHLNWEFSRPLYDLTGYDDGFLIMNYIEKHHPDEVLWIPPQQRLDFDNREVSFATDYYLDDKPFGVHFKAGSLDPQGGHWFADKTKELKPRFIAYALGLVK